MLKVELIEKTEWDSLCFESVRATVFHTWEWCSSTSKVLGSDFVPMAVYSNNEPEYLLPVFLRKQSDIYSGFSIGGIGYGGPCPITELHEAQLLCPETLDSIIKLVELNLRQECRTITLYPHSKWKEITSFDLSNTHVLDISGEEEALFQSKISGNVRTAIRKAQKSGVQVRQLSEGDLEDAHALLAATQSGVNAGYTTSLPFLKTIFGMSNPNNLMFGAFYRDSLIGMGVFLLGRKETFHLFNGWSRDSAPLCANQLILWEAIRRSKEQGITQFNMGESHYQSLVKAKERWGAQPVPVLRFKMPFTGDVRKSEKNELNETTGS